MEHRAELTVLKQFLTGELEYSPEFISIIFSLLDIFQNSFAGRLFRFFSSMKVKHRTAFRRAAGGIACSRAGVTQSFPARSAAKAAFAFQTDRARFFPRQAFAVPTGLARPAARTHFAL